MSTVSDAGALISRTQLMNVLRNPWRTKASQLEVVNPKIEDVPVDEAATGAMMDTVSSLTRVPVSRYAMSGLAMVKVRIPSSLPDESASLILLDALQLCSLLPPFRETLPPPGILYTLILLCIVDLQARNVVVSSTLNACHALGLLWIGRT